MTRRASLAYLATLVAALAFGSWTWLTRSGALDSLDASALTPGPDPWSPAAQVMAAIAVVTTPTVVYVVLAILTVWAVRRRLHNLAWASGLTIVLVGAAVAATKSLVARPRPATALPLITAEGWSYPSAHMTAVTALIVLVLAAVVLTRQRRPVVLGWGALTFVVWWLIAVNRWWLRAHHPTDIVGGALLGGTMAALALAVAGVHVVRLPEPTASGAPRPGRRAALVVNPTRITDWGLFTAQVQGIFAQQRWADPEWHLTTADHPGRLAARRARAAKVDLVLVAGGDGTVRAVCAELADSGIPVGILPVGTGNLLARNLDIPLDLADALDTALDGHPRPIDLVELRADAGDVQHSLVMAGLGADAAMVAEASHDLKRVVGSGAYVISGLQAMNRPPFGATLTLDDADPLTRTPAMVLVASVGRLQGNIELLPDARPDDGLLDVLVASPKGVTEWAVMTSRVLVGAPDAPGAERAQAARVVVETTEPVPYQIDGDAAGTCSRLEATMRHHAVLVMVP